MEDERIPKKVLKGNNIIQDQWKNQEQDRRMLSSDISQILGIRGWR